MFVTSAIYAELQPVLTISETADFFGCHPNTIRNMIARGDLKAVRSERLVRIPRHAIIELLEKAETGTGS